MKKIILILLFSLFIFKAHAGCMYMDYYIYDRIPTNYDNVPSSNIIKNLKQIYCHVEQKYTGTDGTRQALLWFIMIDGREMMLGIDEFGNAKYKN